MREILFILTICLSASAWPADCGIKSEAEMAEVGHSIKKFSQVSPALYRGSRPNDPEDFDFLESKGIKTIVSLEEMPWHVGPEREKAKGRFGFINVGITASPFEPNENDVDLALQYLNDPEIPKPVYVHCAIGRDRTSLIVGLYRIQTESCAPKETWNEMKQFGFSEGIHLRGLKSYFVKHTGWSPDSNNGKAPASEAGLY
jgi:hypothetical protein